MSDSKRVKLGLEDFEKNWPSELKGLNLGALLHPASIMPDYRHTLDHLKEIGSEYFTLKALFGPQHGIMGDLQDNMLESDHVIDAELDIPIWSLYSETREPTEKMLSSIDVLLIDLQDVGSRYYTYVWSMYLCMKACEKQGKKVVVQDRPNPISNRTEGLLLEKEFNSFVGLEPILSRHGKTIGELAKHFKDKFFNDLKLFVVEMEEYSPEMYFDETGLPWVLPSPNMPTLDTAIVYPGMCLLEACNLSEGRGTTKPFELFGAPWLDAKKLVNHMNGLGLAGVSFREEHFLPTFHKYASESVAGWNDDVYDEYRGQVCHGAQIHVLERKELKAFEMAVEILKYCFKTYPSQFKWRPAEVGYEYNFKYLGIDLLLGSQEFRKKEIEGSL